MKKTSCLSILLLLIGFLFVTCSKNTVTRRYYIIELKGETGQARPLEPAFDYKVDVRNFLVASAYDQTRIALRTKSHELIYYFYHHWAVKPSYSVADFVYEIVEQRNMFGRLRRGISYNPDYIITGEVKSIERLDIKKETFAHVHMLLELREAESEQTLLQYQEDQQLPLERDTSMNAFAFKISEILIHMTDEFLQRVEDNLNKDVNRSSE